MVDISSSFMGYLFITGETPPCTMDGTGHRGNLLSLAKILDDLLHVILSAWRCCNPQRNKRDKEKRVSKIYGIIYHTPV